MDKTSFYKLTILYFALFSFTGCGFFKVKEVSKAETVTIPVTVSEAKDKNNPPKTVVTVERKKETAKGGGGSCHALPVCLVIAGAHIFQKMFPKKYDFVTVTENGKKTYSGTYTTSGGLIQGRLIDGNSFKDFFNYRLPKLGKEVVVQVREGRLENGKAVNVKDLAILPQLDLTSEYRSKLSEYPDNAYKRGLLIQEAMISLQKESLPFVEERLTDPKELSQTRGMIVGTLCKYKTVFPENLIQKTLPHPGPHAAKEALLCFLNQKKPLEELTPFVPDMVQGICTGEIDERRKGILIENVFREGKRLLARLHERLIKLTIEDEKQLRQMMGEEFKKCSSTPMATLGKMSFGQEVDVEEIVTALKDNQTQSWLIRRLSLDKPKHKEAFIQVLGNTGPGPRENLLKKLKPYCSTEEIESIRSTLKEKGKMDLSALKCLAN